MVHHTTSYCVWKCTKIVWKSHKILNNSFYGMDGHHFEGCSALFFIKMSSPFKFKVEPIFILSLEIKIKSTITLQKERGNLGPDHLLLLSIQKNNVIKKN